jgi:hypothetical protein
MLAALKLVLAALELVLAAFKLVLGALMLVLVSGGLLRRVADAFHRLTGLSPAVGQQGDGADPEHAH